MRYLFHILILLHCVEMGEVKREVGQFFVCIKGTQCTFEGPLDEESRTLA